MKFSGATGAIRPPPEQRRLAHMGHDVGERAGDFFPEGRERVKTADQEPRRSVSGGATRGQRRRKCEDSHAEHHHGVEECRRPC